MSDEVEIRFLGIEEIHRLPIRRRNALPPDAIRFKSNESFMTSSPTEGERPIGLIRRKVFIVPSHQRRSLPPELSSSTRSAINQHRISADNLPHQVLDNKIETLDLKELQTKLSKTNIEDYEHPEANQQQEKVIKERKKVRFLLPAEKNGNICQ